MSPTPNWPINKMLYSESYPQILSTSASPPNSLSMSTKPITHDHKGRKLSPALSNLLSTTVIPKPKKLKKRPSSRSIRPGIKTRTDSNSSTDSTSSAVTDLSTNSTISTTNSITHFRSTNRRSTSPPALDLDDVSISYSPTSRPSISALSSSTTSSDSCLSADIGSRSGSAHSETRFRSVREHRSNLTLSLSSSSDKIINVEDNGVSTNGIAINAFINGAKTNKRAHTSTTWQGAFKGSLAALSLGSTVINNNNYDDGDNTITPDRAASSGAVPIAYHGKRVDDIRQWVDEEDDAVSAVLSTRQALSGLDLLDYESLLIGSAGSSNSIESSSSSNSITTGPVSRRKIEIPDFEVSVDDHPLRSETFDEEELDQNEEPEQESEPIEEGSDSKDNSVISKTKRLLAKKSIVSNLTASIKAISLMASSLSNSQQNQTANYLSFGPRSMDEPHPAQLLVVSSPSDAPSTPTRPKLKPVSLKTYNIQTTIIPGLRPRELRMNSDFYRIYAVEHLMKVNGKVEEEFIGRAQMILGPRQDNNSIYLLEDEFGSEEIFGIRKRFVSSFDLQDRSKSQRKSYIPTSLLAYSVSIDDV